MAGGESVAHIIFFLPIYITKSVKVHTEVKIDYLLTLMSFQTQIIFFVLWKNVYAALFLYNGSDKAVKFPKKYKKPIIIFKCS